MKTYQIHHDFVDVYGHESNGYEGRNEDRRTTDWKDLYLATRVGHNARVDRQR